MTDNEEQQRGKAKRAPLFSRVLLLIITSLTLLVVSLAVIDYYEVRKITFELAEERASGFIRQVESSMLRAAWAEESVRLALTDQLISSARLLSSWAENSYGNYPDLVEFCEVAGVSIVELFDPAGRLLKSSSRGQPGALILPDDDKNGSASLVQGFYGGDSGEDFFGVVFRSNSGDLIRVGIRAIELLAVRQELGPGALLIDLGHQPEIHYAVLDSKEGLIAATEQLPQWVTNGGDGGHYSDAVRAEEFRAEFIQTPDGPLFEASAPFGTTGDLVLKLGLQADYLQSIRQRNLWALIIRSLMFILLLAASSAFLISRQNVRYLEGERARILQEIRSLEADRSLQERLTAMGELAGGVAHEIRNPLNTITMAAQRLEKEIDPAEQPEQYRAVVTALGSESRRIERIVGGFLRFSRPPRALKQKAAPAVELRPTLDSFRQLADGKQIVFSVNLEPVPDFEFDADLLRQALLNLLQNSLEAVSAGSGIIAFTLECQQKRALFKVEDNGSGIPPEQKQRVFDLYFTTRPNGTGIGLPLVHRIAMEHNGRVEIEESSLGGCCITMQFSLE